MKNPYSVLREKEKELERLRKEVQALLTVIPLLADDRPSDFVDGGASSRETGDLPDKNMAELELYYPFIKHLRMSGGAER
jgi:hypothetical protein